MHTSPPPTHSEKDMLNSPGPKPQFKWLPIDELFVESQYQRSTKSDASRKNISYLAEKFNWAACGTITVSFDGRRKKYAVIDGQHRVQAARNRGDIKEMPCFIVEHTALQDQAASFVEINTRRVRLSNLAGFAAAVASGDEMAMSLKKIIDEAKITIPLFPSAGGQTAPRESCALGAMLRMLETCSRAQAKWVLTIIPDAYGEEKGQMRSALITTLANAIVQDPKLDRVAMIEALRDNDPVELQGTARAIAKAQGGRVPQHMLDILMRCYRSKLRRAA